MRRTHLWLSALALAGCAHRSPEPVAQSQAQALSRESHPAREARASERPAPHAAQVTPKDEQRAAEVETAAPPAQTTAPVRAELAPTATPSDVSVAAPEPANAVVVAAPMHGAAPDNAPAPGADIARADAELRERVQRALQSSSSLSYTAKHVQVDVARRQVTLRGEVRTARERGELEQIVRGLPGVKKLDNQVALINPASSRLAP